MKFNKKTLTESLKMVDNDKKFFTNNKKQNVVVSEEQLDRLLSKLTENEDETTSNLKSMESKPEKVIVDGLLTNGSYIKDNDRNEVNLGDTWETLFGNVEGGNTFRVDLEGTGKEYKPLHTGILNMSGIQMVHLDNIVNDIPDEIGGLENLEFLSLPNNPELTSLPDSIGDLPNLSVLNIKNSPVVLSDNLRQKLESRDIVFVESSKNKPETESDVVDAVSDELTECGEVDVDEDGDGFNQDKVEIGGFGFSESEDKTNKDLINEDIERMKQIIKPISKG
jgi:hypothetical protein